MDLLRAVLQPSINEEIRGVFNKYMKFFQKAAINVRDNVGEEVDPEQLIQETCRSCLEQAKLLFSDGKKVVPRLPHEQAVPKRARQMEEELNRRGSPIPKKRKGRPPGQSLSNDRGVSGMAAWKLKVSEPVRRDGPKWDPSRLTETTTFVLGSRANKALGMGGTRVSVGSRARRLLHLFSLAALRPGSLQPPTLSWALPVPPPSGWARAWRRGGAQGPAEAATDVSGHREGSRSEKGKPRVPWQRFPLLRPSRCGDRAGPQCPPGRGASQEPDSRGQSEAVHQVDLFTAGEGQPMAV
ncbi:deoxynucleotidyltransferase terminal-interacting protein 1 [Athene cunicularia]|uniref:deoxynucleotidyltransferase terminal-interacting protein 1 n=1 Tax=Athene cunicularia TaxID=194338 RepID=UPI000EF64001|nr:deoxynucleotidyltransferase terminal-interacting protein 1 [Athene cunicularia]